MTVRPARASAWQEAHVTAAYLERRRRIPLWQDQADLLCRLVERTPQPITRFLDLGSGDGLVADLVLRTHPQSEAVLVDYSAPMLEAARRRFSEGRFSGGSAQWLTVEADLSSPGWVDALPQTSGYDAVLSGFCIHHLAHVRKRALYAECFDLLAPGGFFINWEHVSPPKWGRGLFEQVAVEALVQSAAERGDTRSAAEIEREYRDRPDARENKLLDVETQCEWLHQIGFGEVHVYFRWLELVLFGGIKPQPEAGRC